MDNQQPIPAATVIVMREAASGPPELLMVERAAAMRFAGGALVFPGGRVDPADHALAAPMPGDPDDNAARIAAIRETLEEAGLPVALDLAAEMIPAIRHALHAGAPMAPLIAAAGGTMRPEALVPFARWLPHGLPHRVFDTRFYLAQARPDDPVAVVDGNENVRLFWASACDVLADAEGGKATVIFPTRRNLERLARFASFEEAVADAVAHPVRAISPWVETRDGGEHLCIPDDLGYPVTAERLDRALRA
jgi:8-oxo-dGTP pyrophosphatase MutT (NUDIX family)